MNEDQNMPDELWRRAFDEATETPPPRVWSAIERQLDESGSGRIVPLWANSLSRPWLWGTGVAAAITLLLVGLWLVRPNAAPLPALADVKPAKTRQPTLATQPGQATLPDYTAARSTSVPKEQQPSNSTITPNEPGMVAVASGFNPRRLSEKHTGPAEQETATLFLPPLIHHTLVETTVLPGAASLTNMAPVNSIEDSDLSALMTPEQLASRGVRLHEMRPFQRVVWFRPAETEPVQSDKEQVRVAAKTKWASVSVMPGVFNPAVSVALPAYANALAYNSTAKTGSASAVNSRGSVAVSVQASAGVQLTDRWSVESGVGYLVGRSTVESPGAQPVYNFAQSGIPASNAPAAVGNLYTDLLRSQTGKATVNSNKGAAYDFLISNTNQYANLSNSGYISRQTVANTYAYVQVPVQVGYQLRPRKRLTLALLGGLITNIFVKNTVDDALTIKAGDGVYEPVALVASMGARFRYRSSDRWSASLAGAYQPTITRSTRSDSPVQTHPTTTGVTVGVDYHF